MRLDTPIRPEARRHLRRLTTHLFAFQLVVGLLPMLLVCVGMYLVVANGDRADIVALGVGLIVLGGALWPFFCWLGARIAAANVQWILWRVGSDISPPDQVVRPSSVSRLVDEVNSSQDSLLPRRIGRLGRVLLHELNGKFVALGDALLPLRERDDAEIRELIAAFGRYHAHLSALRAWLRLQPGSDQSQRSRLMLVDLGDVLHEGLKNWRMRRLSQKVSCRPQVWGLQHLLEGVIDNLVNNARQHNQAAEDEGRLRVRVTLSVVDTLPAESAAPWIAGRNANSAISKWVVVQVQDNGGWIDSEDRARLFVLKNDNPEHGIGLAMSRAVMRSFGGDLCYWDPSVCAWGQCETDRDRRLHTVQFRTRRVKAFWLYLPLHGFVSEEVGGATQEHSDDQSR